MTEEWFARVVLDTIYNKNSIHDGQLTILVVGGKPLQFSNEALKGETPPRVNGPEEKEKVINMKSHVVLGTIVDMRIMSLQTLNPSCHTNTVGLRAIPGR